MKHLTITILLLQCIIVLSSCETPMQKKIARYEKEGKVIIWFDDHCLFFQDTDAIKYEDIQSSTIITMVDFSKDYYCYWYVPFLKPEKSEIFLREMSTEDYDSFKISPEDYYFSNMGNFAISMVSKSNPQTDSYVVLCSQPDKLLKLRNPTGFITSEIGMAVDEASPSSPRASKWDCILFTAADGDLWEYGRDFRDDAPPRFPAHLMNSNIFAYWVQNDYRLPMDIFKYEVDVVMLKDGSIYWIDDLLRFPNMKKGYNKEDIQSGEMFSEFNAKMSEIAEEQYVQDIEEKTIEMFDITTEYKSNRIKAEKDYPLHKDMIIVAPIEKIERASGGGYVLTVRSSILVDAKIYTTDDKFASLSYPCDVWVQTRLTSVSKGWLFDSTLYFIFSNARLLLYK